MSSESLKEYEEIIARRAQLLLDRLGNVEDMVDLAAWIGYFT